MDAEVIVVGAGPAGSIAAYECAKRGLKTLLLEKHELPRQKPCGGAVMYRGLRVVQEGIPSEIVERRIHGLRFILPRNGPAEFSSDSLLGITVMRHLFDEYLAKRAEKAGVEVLEKACVTDAQATTEKVMVTLLDGRRYEGCYVIGADGVNSRIGTSLGLRPPRKDPTRVGLGMECNYYVGKHGVEKAMNGNSSILEMIPATDRLSYGWVFPKKGHLCVGIAGPAFCMKPLRAMFEDFKKKTSIRLGVELNGGRPRSCFLGGNGFRQNNVGLRCLLVGDAAGFVDPMMGEGIAYAMRSGQIAAKIIAEAIEKHKSSREFLSKYQALCNREFAESFDMAARAGVRGGRLAESILPPATRLNLSSEILTGLARGDIDYSDIPYLLVTKLPRELPHVLRESLIARINGGSSQ